MSGKLHQDIHKSEYQQHIRAVRRKDYNKRKQKQLIVVNGGRGRILRLLRFRCFRRLGIFALCAAFFYGRALLHLLCAGYSSLAHSPQLVFRICGHTYFLPSSSIIGKRSMSFISCMASSALGGAARLKADEERL